MVSDLDYVPLDLRNLPIGVPLTCDLYIRAKEQYVLYREASLPFKEIDRKRLMSSGVTNLWIRMGGDSFLEQQLASLLAQPDEQLPPHAKAELLYTSAAAITKRAVTNVSPASLADVDKLIGTTVSHLALNRTAFPALLSVMLHDFSVYTHALNVAVYAISLARFVGIADNQDLRNLGVAAIFHDAGKARIPNEILNKPGPLSPEEWAVMRQHPLLGTELLSQAGDLPEIVLKVVGQHHERLDGSGYPMGIGGEDFHQFSMIVALADSYDAMTCDRSYRSSLTPFRALSLLKEETVAAGKLDPTLFACLVRLLGNPDQRTAI